MSQFPVTSMTLIAKIRDFASGDDSAEWVRFWDLYHDAIRNFAVLKGGERNADDIVMSVLGKLVGFLRSGKFTPEKGRFHSYLATMIVNEVRMRHRKDLSDGLGRNVSMDAALDDEGHTVAETVPAPVISPDVLDDDWRRAVLESARDHVLNHTALSERDRRVYRAYALEGRDIADVSRQFGLSRNYVSQIKVRVDRRIVARGRELIGEDKQP